MCNYRWPEFTLVARSNSAWPLVLMGYATGLAITAVIPVLADAPHRPPAVPGQPSVEPAELHHLSDRNWSPGWHSTSERTVMVWRYTRNGWEEIPIAATHNIRVEDAEPVVHPLVWLGLKLFWLAGFVVWASSEWEWARLAGISTVRRD